MNATKKILNEPIGKDEHGDVYFCRYSKQSVSFKDSILIGALVPQVKGSFVCHLVVVIKVAVGRVIGRIEGGGSSVFCL